MRLELVKAMEVKLGDILVGELDRYELDPRACVVPHPKAAAVTQREVNNDHPGTPRVWFGLANGAQLHYLGIDDIFVIRL